MFAEDWVTSGWSRGPDNKWIELGHSKGIKSYPESVPPKLNIHDIANRLNMMEELLEHDTHWLSRVKREFRNVKSNG
jgi:hypothetical protein